MAFQAGCLAVHSAPLTDLFFVNVRGDDTAHGRNRMTEWALNAGADWLLWLDADMVFPPDALARLLAHDVDIVGADYRRREAPFDRIGLFVHPDDKRGLPEFRTVEAQSQTTGLAERGMLGLGLFLVRANVFRKLPAPWFQRVYVAKNATPDNPLGFCTEDSFFCNYARYHGFRVWCDLDLSAEVQHVGEAAVPFRMPGEVPAQQAAE